MSWESCFSWKTVLKERVLIKLESDCSVNELFFRKSCYSFTSCVLSARRRSWLSTSLITCSSQCVLSFFYFSRHFSAIHLLKLMLCLVLLFSIRPVSTSFSKSAFLIPQPRNFSCFFLILSIIFLLVYILSKASSFLASSVHVIF